MANPVIGKEHNSKPKKVLNNSNPDLASIMAHTSAHIQVLLLIAILTTYASLLVNFTVWVLQFFNWEILFVKYNMQDKDTDTHRVTKWYN